MKKRFAAALTLVVTLLALLTPAALAADPVVLGNEKAKVDITNTADGYIKIAYTGGESKKIKVRIVDAAKKEYNYNLNNKGDFETFPLSEGDGKYTVGVFVNTQDSKYSTAFSTSFDVKLKDQFAPFLVSNQYVSYTEKSSAITQAAELTKGVTKDLDKVTKIYEYVVKNFTYDKEKAASVQSGYLPDVDKILSAKKGICFDYAALMTAMLRSQKVPCRLVVGYAGDVYHAWINVYTPETGWIEGIIQFDGKSWQHMDPTFASTGKQSADVMKYIGDGKNYAAKLYY
jgi:uncharacterized protein YdbL (DUF1318 family)